MNLDKQKGKIFHFKKIFRVISYCLLTVFLFVYLFLALLNTSIMQSIMAAKLSDYFSKELKTELRIGALSINIFDGVSLKDVYVESQKGDTILSAENISVKLFSLPSSKGINVSSIKLEKTTFNLEKGDDGLNFQFIIDYFKSDKPNKKETKKPFVIEVNRLKLKDVNFSLRLSDNKKVYSKDLVAINNMRYRGINADMQDISVIKDSINVKIKKFAVKEASGLEIKNLSGEFLVCPKTIIAKNVNLKTLNSDLYFDALMKTKTWKTYSNFIDSVYCEGEIKKGSIAGMKDATYWTETIKGFEQKAEVSAKFYGTVADLHCESLEVKAGKNTYVKANGTIYGLPKPENTVYNIFAQQIKTSYADYKSMKLGEMLENLPIPTMVSKLGRIDMEARFSGLISNFDALAQINTEIGDVNVIGSSISDGKNITYSADLLTEQFDVGLLLDLPWVSTTQFGVKAEATGTNLNNLSANIVANLKDISLKGNTYDSIYVEGQMKNKEITAQCYVKYNTTKLIASTEFVLGEKKSLYVNADFENINPNKLNLFELADSTTSISGKIIADIQDLNMEALVGNVSIQDLKFKMAGDKTFSVKHFNAQMSSNQSVNSLVLYSDILDFSMVGKYTFESLGKDISWVIKKYMPKFDFISNNGFSQIVNLIDETYQIKSDFNFTSTIKNSQPIFALFAPTIFLSNNTIIDGSCNNNDKINLNIKANKLSIGNIVLNKITLDSKVRKEELYTNIGSANFMFSDSLAIKNVMFDLVTNSNKLNFDLNFADNDSKNRTKGHLRFKSLIITNSLQGSFEDSQIEILGTEILINNNNIIGYNGKQLAILNFSLNKMRESITINGIASGNSDDEIEVEFDNVDISAFNPVFKDMGFELGGRINRNIKFKSLFNKPSLTSNLIVDSLMLNNNLLGFTELNVSNTLINDEFFVNIKLLYKGNDGQQNTPLVIKGFIYPENKNNNLDLTLSLKNFNLNVIEKFLNSFSSEAEGYMSGEDIKIKGKFNQPDIRGILICDKGAIKIDMINTKYYFSDTIILKNNRFILNNFKLRDIQNNKLVIDGTITHDKFKDFYLNLIATADKIKILNTKASSEQMYYGEAYASARASILGDLSTLNIDVKAKTEKGTNLVIPISSKTSVSNNSFIKFTSITLKEKDTLLFKKNNEKKIDLNVNVDLTVTPEAIISIPMSFTQIGGDLKASGRGELKMEINNKGKFNMYGLVNIESGTFGLSIMNVIEKIFLLERGGTIQFNGNPTDAYLDVSAVYKTKASLAPILGEDKYSKQVDVQSVISLSGKMMNPIPIFDIRLPNTDQQTVDELFMHIDKNDEKQMLEQTVSLLVSRQFYSTSGTVESNIGGPNISSSAFELAFGQITGMLTNMITFVDVGVNYTAGTEVITDQFDVNVSKNIGRWEIEFNSVFGGKTQQQAKAASSFIGDINVEYKITDNFRLKAFNKSNADDFTKYNITPYTQGIGITYKTEYDHFSDIFKSRKQRNKVLK